MSLKIAIFVDGPNFIGSIRRLHLEIDNFTEFYRHLLQRSAEQYAQSFVGAQAEPLQLWRINWYQIGSIDDIRIEDPNFIYQLREMYRMTPDISRAYHAIAGRENPNFSFDECWDIGWDIFLHDARTWYESRLVSLDKIRAFNRAIRSSLDFTRMIESGHWKVDLLRRQTLEKGVDTALAVDLVTLSHAYDIAILVSGDADMIPSLHYAKQHGKHVGVVEFRTPSDRSGAQSSSRLKNESDFLVSINSADLLNLRIAKVRN